MNYGTANISGNVQVSGNKYGLYIETSGSSVELSGGTYKGGTGSGNASIKVPNGKTVGDLLAEDYAYYKVSGNSKVENTDVASLAYAVQVLPDSNLTPVEINGTDQTVTYNGNTIDVSTMFSGIPDGSDPTYSIVTGEGFTGEGSIENANLTVTQAGTFQIKVTTQATDSHAAGEATATLTVNKASRSISAPTKDSVTTTSVTLKAVTVTGDGTVMYAKNSTNVAPSDGWQTTPTFNGLAANTTYYFFARVTGGVNYEDAISSGTAITTSNLTPEPTPAAVFTATGPDTGTLSNVDAGMKYKIDSGEWKDIGAEQVDLTGLTACTISVVKKGDGTTTSDSAVQAITVTKAETPNANKTNCTTSANNNGTITNVTTEMEYKADDGNWTDVTGTAITGLAPGTYYVRVKAAGTALASEPQTLTIGAFSSTGKEITVRIHTHGGTSSDTVSGGDQTQLGVTHTITVTPGSGKYVVAGYFAGLDYYSTNPSEHQYTSMTLEKTSGADSDTGAVTFQFTATEYIPVENDPTYVYIPLYFHCAALPEKVWTIGSISGEATAPSADGSVAAIPYESKYELCVDPGKTGGYYELSDAADRPYLSWSVASITDASGNDAGGSVSFDNNRLTYTPTAAEAGKTVTIVVQPRLGLVMDEIPTLTFKITVKDANTPQTGKYTVSTNVDGNGYAWAFPNEAEEGDTIYLYIQAAQGYYLYSLEIDSGNIQLGADSTFTMPAHNVEVKVIFKNSPPVLSDGTASRDSLSSAAVKFVSSEAGQYYYAVVEQGADAPVIDTTGTGIPCTGGENTISLSSLAGAGAKDIYIVAKDSLGNESNVLKITIPAYYAPGSGIVTSYRVTVEGTENGVVASSHSWAVPGVTVTLSVSPGEGYELASLTITKRSGDEVKYTDKGNGKYTFTMPGSDVIVKAAFAAMTPGYADCPRDETCPIWPFTDASTTAWYHDGVHYCLENGLMKGTGANTFSPNSATSRAMIATILWRLSGSPVVNYAMTFTDVEPGSWYAEAVRWAASQGVVTGYSDEIFAPDKAISREELAAMLYRYAQSLGMTVTALERLSGYPDGDSVKSYAVEAVNWAVYYGIINGKDGLLAPGSGATRAEAATMLMRFCEGNII